MPLTDTAIKNAKPGDRPYKIQDEKGMYLLVHSNGSKYFRFDYSCWRRLKIDHLEGFVPIEF